MPDVRLIDANALVKTIEAGHCKDCNNYNGAMCRACTWMDAMDYIEDATTIDAQQTVDINAKFNESDFTDEELKLLKGIFKGADAVVQSTRVDNYDTFMSNTLYSLTQKLGIDDIVD